MFKYIFVYHILFYSYAGITAKIFILHPQSRSLRFGMNFIWRYYNNHYDRFQKKKKINNLKN